MFLQELIEAQSVIMKAYGETFVSNGMDMYTQKLTVNPVGQGPRPADTREVPQKAYRRLSSEWLHQRHFQAAVT